MNGIDMICAFLGMGLGAVVGFVAGCHWNRDHVLDAKKFYEKAELLNGEREKLKFLYDDAISMLERQSKIIRAARGKKQ